MIHIEFPSGRFNSRPYRAAVKYFKSTLYFWRVSKKNSLNRFIVQHLNLGLGVVIFYFLLPWKVETLLTDQIALVFFSLPNAVQTQLNNLNAFFSSVPWLSIRLIFSTAIAAIVNLFCPTTPRNVFRSSLRGAYIQLFVYLGIIFCVFFKEIAKILWYNFRPHSLNEPTKA